MKTKEVSIAYEYGKKAFHNGLKCIPAHDKEFLEKFIAGLKVGEGIQFTKAWLKGWHNENLKKEV